MRQIEDSRRESDRTVPVRMAPRNVFLGVAGCEHRRDIGRLEEEVFDKEVKCLNQHDTQIQNEEET